jgi:hypothetical protein
MRRKAYLSFTVSTRDGFPDGRTGSVGLDETERVRVSLSGESGIGDVRVKLLGDEVGPDTSSDGRSDTLGEVEDGQVGSSDGSEIYRIQ